MTSISKNVYRDTLDDIVNNCNNTYHRDIKMKIVNIKPSKYFDFNKENDKESAQFKFGDHVRISKVPNWYEELFVITNVISTMPWTYVNGDFKD